jgi:hypothetical protein
MKWHALLALGILIGCNPQSGDNPRDRQGQPGATTWRIVADAQGQAAFLSKPGAAPDLVIWCRGDGLVTLRAHVFEAPANPPDLALKTDTGDILFQTVRNQGGMRATDRKLVEGQISASEPRVIAGLAALDEVKLRNGERVWSVSAADPQNVLPAFAAACKGR